ncbi:discoidin domain-containing protein [Paenibacillus hexagrammi]|uniref:Discoidin domain-containing protein n=1 Tax=Paenibacillus hexagrammi TaxID=2908839 RepID=A0ABY3SLH2_9BACL|nr:discoidin domain-containing protein [Paenibacillus sp. YPD9-1]UJF34904.1 discoidin domain-containing protein [Paenibacillus sp. YPD9-1]
MRSIKKIVSSMSMMTTLALSIVTPGVSQAATPVTDANSTIFGPNVYVFDPSMSAADIQSATSSVFSRQETNEFGTERDAFLFKPGTYNVDFKVGFNTQVSGLGQNPGDVKISGGVNVDAQWDNGNATRNFWRSIENLTVLPTSGVTRIAVSQAAPLRRLHIKGELQLFDFDANWNAGWASGGYLADSIVDKAIIPASQQQWFSRNSNWASWSNGVWNMVFVGDTNPPAGQFPDQPYTVVEKTPVMREKPYLYINDAGVYQVFVPSLQQDTKGVSWENGATPGQSISIDQFYIAHPDSSDAASINTALSEGKNLIFTPGIYHLNDTIRINNANTVVLGIGMPSLVPDNGQTAMTVADVDGVKIAGLVFDAGPNNSPSLLEVGPSGSSADHAANPTSLHDLFFRTGGFIAGKNDSEMTINSDDVIGDHFWMWRADHGAGAGWTDNVSKNGLVVNGDDVTIYGLFNEHHNEYQTLWNGNGGRVYFYQSEIPYDVPNQEAWMSKNGTENGYPSYKVSDSVTSHEAWGLGVYSYFRDAAVKLNNAIEVPQTDGVKVHHATTIWLNGTAGSEITHVINDLGGRVYGNSPAEAMRQTVTEFTGSDQGDTQAPSVPGNLTAVAASSSQINLSWNASSDNVSVTGYEVYRDGKLIATTTSASYNDTGLKASTAYSYTVKAKDGAGNLSEASNTASATTSPKMLDRTGWTAESTPSSGDAASNLLDGNMDTRWSTGTTMVPGQFVTVDMKAVKSFNGIVMDSTGSNQDYARGYEVYVSNDGINWGAAVASGTGTGAVVTASFAPQQARYIKVVQTGTSSSWWSVREFNVYEAPAAGTTLEGNEIVTSNQSFDVTLGLNGMVTPIYAQDVTIEFDPGLLEFVSAESLLENLFIVDKKVEAGKVRLITANVGGQSLNGNLITLHMKAKSPEESTSTAISLTKLLTADAQGTEQNIDGTSFTVQVKAVVDMSALNALIADAQAKHDAAVEGSSAGQYPAGSKQALQTAIDAAQAVADNSDATKEQVAQAITDLNAALQTFKDSVITRTPGDTNNDGTFSIGDLAIVAAAYGKTSNDQDWEHYMKADMNQDNQVDLFDLTYVAQKILQ